MGRAPGFEVRPGTILTRLSREEAASLLAAWLAVFGRAPAPHMTTFPWHVCSAAAYPSLARQAALDAYAAVACPEGAARGGGTADGMGVMRPPSPRRG